MQAIAIACSVLLVIVDFGQAQEDNSLYTKRYERLDIDTILASPRLVTNYVECLLNKKPCAPEGKALKRILPEALRTKCGRCQPSQKEIALKVITALYFDYPQYYKALQERWDPSGEYNKRFEEYLRDQKFNSIGGGAESEAEEQAQGSSYSINITQRPTRQGQVAQGQGSGQAQAQGQGGQAEETKPNAPTTDEKDLPEILNRFGNDDEDSGYDYESNNGNNSPSSGGSSRPSHSSSGSNSAAMPPHTWTQHNQPAQVPGFSTTTTYYLNTQNPVLNIINRITMKFANTAEFIAGMLRGAVPQPQAPIHKDEVLSKFCDRLRKTFMSYTNNNNFNNQNKKTKHHQRFN